jgi:hypothetical protein
MPLKHKGTKKNHKGKMKNFFYTNHLCLRVFVAKIKDAELD